MAPRTRIDQHSVRRRVHNRRRHRLDELLLEAPLDGVLRRRAAVGVNVVRLPAAAWAAVRPPVSGPRVSVLPVHLWMRNGHGIGVASTNKDGNSMGVAIC